VPCVVMSEFSAHAQVQFVLFVMVCGFYAHPQVQFLLCEVTSVGFSVYPQVQFVLCVVMSMRFPHINRYSLCPVW